MAATVFYSQCICRNLKANLRLNPERDSLHSKLFRSLCVFPIHCQSKWDSDYLIITRNPSVPDLRPPPGAELNAPSNQRASRFTAVKKILSSYALRWKSLMERDATEMFLILNKLVEHILHIQHIFYTIKI